MYYRQLILKLHSVHYVQSSYRATFGPHTVPHSVLIPCNIRSSYHATFSLLIPCNIRSSHRATFGPHTMQHSVSSYRATFGPHTVPHSVLIPCNIQSPHTVQHSVSSYRATFSLLIPCNIQSPHTVQHLVLTLCDIQMFLSSPLPSHFDLLYSNSICRQSSIPTSIFSELIMSGKEERVCTARSRSFTRSESRRTTTTRRKYLRVKRLHHYDITVGHMTSLSVT